MGEIIKRLEISLETKRPEVIAYLEGYLMGIHDIGWARVLRPKYNFRDVYMWIMDVKEKRYAYSTMEEEEIKIDLGKVLECGLGQQHYIKHYRFNPLAYTINIRDVTLSDRMHKQLV